MTTTRSLSLSLSLLLVSACALESVDDADWRAAPNSAGDGLLASYYDDDDLTDLVMQRVDTTVDFSWGRGAPAAGIGADTFSVRWVGFVEPRYSQTYRFYVTSDDGARLWVDGEALVDRWTDHSPRTYSGTIDLEAGQRYPIELDYYENGGGAMVRLEWSSASQPREVIPRSQLYTSDGLDTVVLGFDDAFVDSADPDRNFDTDALEVDNDPSVKYALLAPRGLSAIPAGSPVARATLVVRAFDGGNDFGVHPLTGSFSESSVTYDNAPGLGARLASVSGSVREHSIDVTSVVQAWVDGEPAHGLALYPRGPNGVDLYSSEHPTASYRPRLVVELGERAEPEEPEEPAPDAITHIGTTQKWDSNGQNLVIERPAGSRADDLLVLVLHRTDDDLPLYVDGWTRVAECYKRDNGYDCVTEDDCTRWHDAAFCAYFGDYGRGGHDLAQAIFVRTVRSNEPGSYSFDLNADSSGHPGWAILTALRGADNSDPVRDWAHEGCDGIADSLFPSVYGVAGDMVLLSQSFDDAIAKSKFGAPTGTSTFGYVSNSDEAGFLFGGILSSTGDTGSMKSHGDGGPSCKDALVSLTIRPR